MYTTLSSIDNALRASGPLKRYSSWEATGLRLSDLYVNQSDLGMVDYWKKKITATLESKVRVKKETRASEGYRIDVDEALAGETDCYRLKRPVKRSPIRIGINLSAEYIAKGLAYMRGGAVLALVGLLMKQARPFALEICYGNGLEIKQLNNWPGKTCHVRIPLQPFTEVITRICMSSETMRQVGEKLVAPIGRVWHGLYRIHEFETAGLHEYDFVLDRIETTDLAIEEKRIMDRLLKLGVAK